jgi:hypothetical protein
MPSREQIISGLRGSEAVTYISPFMAGDAVILHTRDERLTAALRARGAIVRWFDRTEYSTMRGLSKADLQAEIVLGHAFWEHELDLDPEVGHEQP